MYENYCRLRGGGGWQCTIVFCHKRIPMLWADFMGHTSFFSLFAKALGAKYKLKTQCVSVYKIHISKVFKLRVRTKRTVA